MIADFRQGEDLLVLTGGLAGLKGDRLSIVQDGGATSIKIANTDKILATLNGVTANPQGVTTRLQGTLHQG